MDEENNVRTVYLENHKNILSLGFDKFMSNQSFVDVTLVSEKGTKIKLHRAVLAACSPFFEDILADIEENNHPVLVFNEISEEIMVCIIEFMYKGQTDIRPNLTEQFLNTAKKLHIRGLEGHGVNVQANLPQSSTSVKGNMSAQRDKNKLTKNKTANQERVEARPQSTEKKDVPLSIRTDTGVKVLNPFAINQNRSSSTEDELMLPGPSRLDVANEADSSKTNCNQDDSDIEFIEENHAIVVVDSEKSSHEQWLSKPLLQNKRNLHDKATSGESSDDDVPTSHRKKKKNNRILGDEEPDNRQNAEEDFRESSPEFITAITQKEPKNEPVCKMTKNEYLKQSFQMLKRYCVVCQSFKKNIKFHIKTLHSAPLRKQKFFCKTCGKKFYMKQALTLHKCKI